MLGQLCKNHSVDSGKILNLEVNNMPRDFRHKLRRALFQGKADGGMALIRADEQCGLSH